MERKFSLTLCQSRWLVVQDRLTNDNNNEKLILVEDGEYEVSKRLWSFAHFARFIRPGARRIGIANTDTNINKNDNDNNEENELHTSAYLNTDNSYVVVLLNAGYEARRVSVDFGRKCKGVRKVRAWLTDGDNDVSEVEVNWRRGVADVQVTGRGLVTLRTE